MQDPDKELGSVQQDKRAKDGGCYSSSLGRMVISSQRRAIPMPAKPAKQMR